MPHRALQKLRARMRSLWLLQHQRVGSTWLASTHLAQHPHIHMLKHGEGEACFGHFRRHSSNGSNVSCAGECQCFAQLLQHQDACKARKSRVCGWKAGANFCPTPKCASWLWSTLQPTVVHLYRRDMLRQAISLALARSSRIWTCRVDKIQRLSRSPAGQHGGGRIQGAPQSRAAAAFHLCIHASPRATAMAPAGLRRPGQLDEPRAGHSSHLSPRRSPRQLDRLARRAPAAIEP